MKKILVTSAILALLASTYTPSALAHGNIGSVGAGVGASYGFIGGSVDYKLFGNAYGSLGLGSAGDEVGYNAGIRYYFTDLNRTMRPRFSINYGTNGVISRQVCFFNTSNCTTTSYESFEGVSAGLGQSVAFGSGHNHGFEADILYILDDGGKSERIDELEDEGFDLDGKANKLYFSIGYRFSF